jgi:putative flavoprotein involved in K+ transport
MSKLRASATQQLSSWLAQFSGALDRYDWTGAVGLFCDDCYWRDLVSFTWNIKTLEGQAEIKAALASTVPAAKPGSWQVVNDAIEQQGITEGWFIFETTVARGKGHVRLKSGKCWTLLTALTELRGFEEKRGPSRSFVVQQGVNKNRQTWLERKTHEEANLGHATQPYCVIIGGGQGGIALGARLRQLNVPTTIIEKNERPGDSWRRRYKSLCLHDPVWYDHLPYLPFPRNWPVFSPKDKIGDWLEMYTKVMELNYWGSTECKKASYDEKSREWTVVVQRDGKEIVLKPKQLVLATNGADLP